MEKRKELIDYILKNGKDQTWYEFAIKFNIRPGHNRKERTKAANDVWRGYERHKFRTPVSNTSKVSKYIVELFETKQSYITKPALEVAKAVWKILPDSLQPTSVTDLEQHVELVKQIQPEFKQAKVIKVSKEQEQLIDIYNDIIEEKEKSRKKLFFDIETSPNIVFSWRIGHKINITPDNIIDERAIICISYKWEGESKVHSLSWNAGDDKEMLKEFSKIIDSADEIVTQNGDKFDIKWLRARCIYHGIPISNKFNSIDTLKMARAGFNFNSNKLEYMGSFLGVGEKLKTGYDLWKRIVLNDDPDAMKQMIAYCEEDVRLLERVYNKLQPYCPVKKFKYIKK